MKILVITPVFLPIIGGAEMGIHEIFNRIGERNEVCILTPKKKEYHLEKLGVSDEFFNQANYKVIRFWDFLRIPRRMMSLSLGLIPLFSISFVLETFKYIKRFNPDIMNFHLVFSGGLALILTRLFTKIPVVLTLAGRGDTLGKESPFFWKIYLKIVVKSASFVLPISKYILGCLDIKKMKIIPYGVDTKRFSPQIDGQKIRQKFQIANKKLILFILQRLSREKRVDVLIKAMKYLSFQISDAVLIIGGKGPEEKNLRMLSKKLGLEDKIIFAGYIPEEELPQYFAACDIFVFHSTFETFGVVFPQAFASGKPVVSVNSTAIPETVIEGETGLLSEPLNPVDIAQKIMKLHKNDKLYEKLSKNVREISVKKYDWDKITFQYEEVFKKICGQNE